MSSETMSSSEYWGEVASITDNIISECAEDKCDEDELGERIWETIDGHQWVIYTAYHYEVLSHSDNDAYAVENFGAECATQDGTLNTALLAFGALYGDVSDKLWRRVESCCMNEDCEDCGGLGWYDSEAPEPKPEPTTRELCDPAYHPSN